MGLIERTMGLVFGSGANVIRDTAEVFRENAEASAQRQAEQNASALNQFAAEFARAQSRGSFDRVMDGLNRVPRPAMALGTLGLFLAAMIDPIWFAARMQGIALVPEPLWWLLGAIVSFYFGARHQAKGQEFQRSIAETLVRTPQVMRNLEDLDSGSRIQAARVPASDDHVWEGGASVELRDVAQPANTNQIRRDLSDNAALAEWKARNGN